MYTMSSKKYKVCISKQKSLCYNKIVVAKFEKKDQPLALRVPGSLLEEITNISETEDRPLGYVARELMIRGLELYRRDGLLRSKLIDRVERVPVSRLPLIGEIADETKTAPRKRKAARS